MDIKFDCKEENYIIKDNEKKLLILLGISVALFGTAYFIERYMGTVAICKFIVVGTFIVDLVVVNLLKARKKRAFKLKVVLFEKHAASYMLKDYREEREFLLSESAKQSLDPKERMDKFNELDPLIEDLERLHAKKVEQEKELRAQLSIA